MAKSPKTFHFHVPHCENVITANYCLGSFGETFWRTMLGRPDTPTTDWEVWSAFDLQLELVQEKKPRISRHPNVASRDCSDLALGPVCKAERGFYRVLPEVVRCCVVFLEAPRKFRNRRDRGIAKFNPEPLVRIELKYGPNASATSTGGRLRAPWSIRRTSDAVCSLSLPPMPVASFAKPITS
jgi:hypothetical protein